MTTTQTTQSQILAEYDAEYAARKLHWIGGIPHESDLRGLRQIVAHRLAVHLEDVAEALRDRRLAEGGCGR
ncbi:hypothetical protein [Pseudorhodobacter sp.]|uniref:hypothetical protein n=1 Tax=Pseudorhodobacter sp. TaxID=1934400 RepID=UPI002649900B|nr:hypothetical protein [Pseudorhodobacter sp.]MDN5786516.1 hypothetical protein [Pseudorhodobacter sp.]